MRVGAEVKAKNRIVESTEKGEVIHAEPGDAGRIVGLWDAWRMVVFVRSSGAVQCHLDELSDP
jgi:hypothetical protein